VNKEQFTRLIKLSLLCVLSAVGNFLLNNLSVYFMKFPLFLDTVFTIAVTFTAGLIPGLVTAVLSYIALNVMEIRFSPFILCSVAEILLVWRFKPANTEKKRAGNFAWPEKTTVLYVGVFARLMILYIICCFAVSVMGGVIDFFYYGMLSNPKLYFSAEDAFKIGLLRSGIPVLAMDILSRIPVNIVDRFIVIFGGYFISRLMMKLNLERR
jgi:hypothetical protein